jgi:hypothetical protein
MDIFWIYKPKVLIEEYYEILPTKQMSRTKQMNTITRLLIYLIILSLLFDKDNTILLICLTMIIMLIIFYFINKSDDKGVGKDLVNESKDEIEKYTNINKSCNGGCSENTYGNKPINHSINKIYENSQNPITKVPINKNVLIESGYIDFDGNYKIGRDYSDINLKDIKTDKPDISYDKYNYYKENTCRKPTADNPFANIVFADYLDAGNIPEPCNTDDKDIQTSMNQLYNSSIYRNIEDVFERENSQRIFYTVPITTVPNKQTEFANWLYKTGPTCKEKSANCTYYEEPYMISQRY